MSNASIYDSFPPYGCNPSKQLFWGLKGMHADRSVSRTNLFTSNIHISVPRWGTLEDMQARTASCLWAGTVKQVASACPCSVSLPIIQNMHAYAASPAHPAQLSSFLLSSFQQLASQPVIACFTALIWAVTTAAMQLGERERERGESCSWCSWKRRERDRRGGPVVVCVWWGGGGGWRQAEEQCWGQRPLARGNEWKATFKFVCAVQWR